MHGSNISLNDLGKVGWEGVILEGALHQSRAVNQLDFVVSLGLAAGTSEAKVAGAKGFRKMGSAHLPATVTQVEETPILRSDIIDDCGQSLNPAVDLGQASWLGACDNSKVKFLCP
ncbi:hypothetical protein H0E87_008028 [Populus deltoides]|uniref:Uncharacterized protein n=1 Tax=Populus deltoides TaxID=3696 RepID=A0A8T2YZ87_POPDE|nr:hypothetical protein H0E87_008028 [Populus deltoides]